MSAVYIEQDIRSVHVYHIIPGGCIISSQVVVSYHPRWLYHIIPGGCIIYHIIWLYHIIAGGCIISFQVVVSG
jgi:hypothetical protein